MEKGSLRVDANISIRRPGEPLGTKTEVKNMNSFANVERALQVERDRQIALVERGGSVEQVTLLFNAATGEVRPMRSKEESHDYRYFPDPDLPPIVVSTEWIERERAALPELPEPKRERLSRQYGLSAYDAAVLTSERSLADYFEQVVAAGAEPKAAANWVMGEVLAGYNEEGRFTVPAPVLGELIGLVKDGTVSLQAAKKIYPELKAGNESPKAVADRLGLIQVRDASALESWVDEVLAAHPKEVDRYRGGDTKLLSFFVGQVMKQSRGKADPKAVPQLLTRKLL
jgi:aspartyl-tRNA(Asn)/glutamyl-tRNA(Gln) amidotransferase subunit B